MGNLVLDRLRDRVLNHQSDPSHLEMTRNDRRSRAGLVFDISGCGTSRRDLRRALPQLTHSFQTPSSNLWVDRGAGPSRQSECNVAPTEPRTETRDRNRTHDDQPSLPRLWRNHPTPVSLQGQWM